MRLDDPIPPRPARFAADGAPPGVVTDFDAFKWHDGTPWWEHRPIIKPITQVLHTNAAQREGLLPSQINWGNAGITSNTHPHYAVNAPQPTKLVPSDRRGIGNASLKEFEDAYGVRDASFWSLVIETADAGWVNGRPVDGVGDFLYDHAEIVARIFAYEAIVWGIPLEYPQQWTEPGSITHTEPFGVGMFTVKAGKVCPGPAKKRTFREFVLPRARRIADAWTVITPPPEDPPMRYMLRPPADRSGHPWFLRWDGSWSYLTGRDRDLLTADGVPLYEDITERYDLVHAEVFGRSPAG